MPLVPDDGGGSTGSTCTTSPTDQQGQIDNMLTRIETLETLISQIIGEDISAIQLSDISQDVGWVYNVTYMGIEGWTQTAAGTLIPPAGFTVSEILENAQANQLSTNGGGGTSNWLAVEPASASLSGSGLNATADLSNVLYSKGSAFGTSNLGTSTIDINETGYYHISVVMQLGVRSTAGSTWMNVIVKDSGNNAIKTVQDLYGQHAAPNNTNQTLNVSFSFEAIAGYDVEVNFNNTSGSLQNIDKCIVSIEQLSTSI